jgi:carbonic anhydrase
MMDVMTPADTWTALQEGNRRFVEGTPSHPNQSSARRTAIAEGQRPVAALFGCSDSRLAAEIIFDLGLGDLFVVRNMGQIMSSSVIASLEYATDILDVSVIVVLAHDSCGAVQAAIQQESGVGAPLPPNIAAAVGEIVPSAKKVRKDFGLSSGDPLDPDAVGRAHLKETISKLLTSSELVSQQIADGTLAVIGATYTLSEGVVSADVIVGDLSSAP